MSYGQGYPGPAAGGGGSTGKTTTTVTRLTSEFGTNFTVIVGSGGWKAATGGYTIWDCGDWTLGMSAQYNGQGQASSLTYASAPTRTYAYFSGGDVGYSPYWGSYVCPPSFNYAGTGNAGTGGLNGGAAYGLHGGNGANAPAQGGAPGGGGTPGASNGTTTQYQTSGSQPQYDSMGNPTGWSGGVMTWVNWQYEYVCSPSNPCVKTSTGLIQLVSNEGQAGIGTSTAAQANLMTGLGSAIQYKRIPMGYPPAYGGDGYLSVSW
jgi:hypothetical protein